MSQLVAITGSKVPLLQKVRLFFVRIFKFIWKFFKWQSKNPWDNVKFPMIQQVHAKTIAMDLVDVKPLGAPTGTLFYFDYVYPHQENLVISKLKWIQLEIPFPKDSYDLIDKVSALPGSDKFDKDTNYTYLLDKYSSLRAKNADLRKENKRLKELVSSLEIEKLKAQNKAESSYLKSNV